MIKKTFNNIVVFIVSSTTLLILILLLYYLFSNLFFTLKNWNIIETGVITRIWIDTNNSESYHSKMYDVKIDSLIFQAKDEIETNYVIGDTVLVQSKGNSIVRILYVNNKKVGNRINKTEYIMIFFLILLILIAILIIKNKIRKK